MSILVDGILKSSAGNVIGNADIVLTAISTSLVVLGGTPLSIKTDADGHYSFTLHNGNYAVSVSRDGNNWFSGMITVTDLTVPKSINALLLQDAMMAEIPADYWSYFQSQTGILFTSFTKIDEAVSTSVESKNISVAAKDTAVSARNDAEIFSDIAQSGSDSYPSREEAQVAINNGTETRRYFPVKGGGDIWAERYENVSGVATPTGQTLPSGSAINTLNKKIQQDNSSDGIYAIDGSSFPAFATIDGDIFTAKHQIISTPYSGVFHIDSNWFAVELTPSDNTHNNGSNWLSEQIAYYETIARQSREAVLSRGNNAIRPLANYIHMAFYGQSLHSGTEGWPRLSIVQLLDNLMFGDSIMPSSPTAATFSPRGGAALKPLIATCCDATGNLLTDEQVAALAPGTIAYGESTVEGCLNSWRRRHLDRAGLWSDPNRVFVGSATGVGGRSIAQLSKGASPELYNRFYTAITGVKAIADAAGKSYQVGCIVHMQGENDYPSATKEYFKMATLQLRNDMYADIAAVTGQTRMPAFITYQTGASFTRDERDLAVGMAQIELADEQENWFLAGPVYPYTDKNGHLDSNGYRWFAEKLGEVAFRVCERGQDWKPLQPITAVYRGVDVLLSMHVPSPPLRFAEPYVINATKSYTDKGFTVIDRHNGTDTPISILSVDIRGLSTIHITMTREPLGVLVIRYADKANHDGNGMVCDSSNGLSESKYEYLPNSGMYPSANIPELVDDYYDLRNWSVAYQITAERYHD
ncbi:TPA: prophage tail fiber N-terminal domain-containing protein [Serratia fonticola]